MKKEIARLRGEFTEIFVIAEVPRWEPKQAGTLRPDGKLLAVGYDGLNYWLIASFTPVTLEEYIRAQSSSRAQ